MSKWMAVYKCRLCGEQYSIRCPGVEAYKDAINTLYQMLNRPVGGMLVANGVHNCDENNVGVSELIALTLVNEEPETEAKTESVTQ